MQDMSLPAFNRVLARHLALALHAGASCDEKLVSRCYSAAQSEVRLRPSLADDPLASEIRDLCVSRDVDVLKQNESRLRRLSIADAESEIRRLLNPDLRVVGSELP